MMFQCVLNVGCVGFSIFIVADLCKSFNVSRVGTLHKYYTPPSLRGLGFGVGGSSVLIFFY